MRPYLKDIINDLKKFDNWKIAINVISSKGNDKEHVMHSKTDNIETIINDKANAAIELRSQSLLSRYQIQLEISMEGSDFKLDFDHLLYYKCYKMNFKRSQSYIDSPERIKNKKATINFLNKNDNKCFQNAATAALNYKKLTDIHKVYKKIQL